MSYIIWNNKDSRNIKGLLISELSPITKPNMRVKTTTIDGRDGDIIDELGYESYSKKIFVGLYEEYDIDEIMQYFTGKGELILSNEPNKFYKARILKKIDYNRLLKFKKATVEFHVQPYKYLVNEDAIIKEITEETEIKVTNQGLEVSKPIITLYGIGKVIFALNGLDVFSVNIDEYVTIDTEEQEAYKGKILKNRDMSGDFPILECGENIITWTGNLTKIIIEPKSRWL